MDIKQQAHIERLNTTPRWSDATVYKGIAHFVEVAADTAQDMSSQTQQLLAQADVTLAAIKSDKSQLLSATIYLTRAEDAAIFNTHWEAWLPAGCAPSRACIKVELLDPDMRIEIAFVAAVKST